MVIVLLQNKRNFTTRDYVTATKKIPVFTMVANIT